MSKFLAYPENLSRVRWLFSALELSALLAALEIWAVTDHIYWRYVWSDTGMHFLGGLIAGTIAVGIFVRFRPLFFILVVAVIAIGWEVLEYSLGVPRKANFAFDTSLDLFMDALGAVVIYVIARKTLWRSK